MVSRYYHFPYVSFKFSGPLKNDGQMFHCMYFCPLENKLTLEQVCLEVLLKQMQIAFGLFSVKTMFYLSLNVI
jgi:hypothetical protein